MCRSPYLGTQKNRKWEPASGRRCWTWQSLVPFEPPRPRSGQILRVDWIEGRPDPIRRTPNQSGTHWILSDVLPLLRIAFVAAQKMIKETPETYVPSLRRAFRQAAEKDRLAACAARNFLRTGGSAEVNRPLAGRCYGFWTICRSTFLDSI